MTAGALSQSTLGSFHESPLGARETYVRVLKLFDSDGNIVALSPTTMATEQVIGQLPFPARPLLTGHSFASATGDHIVTWLAVLDADAVQWYIYECAPETGRIIRHDIPVSEIPDTTSPHWVIGGNADVIWQIIRTPLDPKTPRQQIAMLAPDDWSIVRLSDHARFSDFGYISRISGTTDIIYWGHSGAGFFPVPQIGVISPVTFGVLRSRAAPPYTRYEPGRRVFVIGVDGDDDRMWVLTYHVNFGEQRDKYHLYDMDPTDLSIRRHREWNGPLTQPGHRRFVALGAN